MSTNVAVRLLTKAEAQALTDRIRDAAETTWRLLIEAYERRAWSAMGYGSWRDYATTEFGMSQSHAYRLLDQARVVSALEEVTGSPMGEISERDARDLKPHLDEFVAGIAERTQGVDEAHVREVVEQAIDEFREEKRENERRREAFLQFHRDNPDATPKFVPTIDCPQCAGSGRIPKEGV